MGENLISFFPSLFFLPSFLHSNSPLILELHKWDLQNRLTLFISSVYHYICVGFEADCVCVFPCPAWMYAPYRALQITMTSDFSPGSLRADERNKPSRAKSKLHPLCIQSSICTQSTLCRPNTAEGDENSVPGMT